jgi:putative transcriptional regulator
MRNDVRHLRVASGLTQQELADRLNVSRRTVVSIEQGQFDPSLPLAFRITQVFHCRIEDVFFPDGSPLALT